MPLTVTAPEEPGFEVGRREACVLDGFFGGPVRARAGRPPPLHPQKRRRAPRPQRHQQRQRAEQKREERRAEPRPFVRLGSGTEARSLSGMDKQRRSQDLGDLSQGHFQANTWPRSIQIARRRRPTEDQDREVFFESLRSHKPPSDQQAAVGRSPVFSLAPVHSPMPMKCFSARRKVAL